MKYKNLIYIGLFILFVIICNIPLYYSNIRLKHKVQELEQYNKPKYDIAYNHVVLDSIEYNIIKKDSIIINYKTQMEYEIHKSNNCSDSDAVKLFYQLLSN